MTKKTPSARCKVLHLITHLDIGGAQDNTLLTVEHLDRTRYEVHLASASDGDWEERGRSISDRFFVVPHLVQKIRPAGDARALGELVGLLRQQEYDIVHTHSSKAGVLGRVAARLVGVPIVVHTVHGFPFHPYMNRVVRDIFVATEKWAASLCDKLIMVSELNRQDAIRLGIAPADKMVTIYSGIDLAAFNRPVASHEKRRQLGLDTSSPVVGTVGRLTDQKAPQDFVRAAKQVLQHRPEAQFVLVGDGPLRSEVEALIGSEQRVRVLGNRPDVPEILCVLDVFVLSSLWEGLGRALTEAMATGVPVVATSVDGVPELVKDGETGFLIPPRRPDLLAQQIIYLLDHPDVGRRLGAQARVRVSPQFDMKHMTAQIEFLYGELSNAMEVRSAVSGAGHEV